MTRVFGIVFATLALASGASIAASAERKESMRSFKSDKQLEQFLERSSAFGPVYAPPPPPPPPVPPPVVVPAPASIPLPNVSGYPAGATSALPQSLPNLTVSESDGQSPGITNTQEAGVDEGGIVKVHGKHLVVLRRGRLFTIDTSSGALAKIDQVDAFPQGDANAYGAWYDEMLVSGDLVVVIGFNYARFGTEINRFRISPSGYLRYLDTHLIRSDDYYSDRNYASRLVGNKLVIYSPIPLYLGDSWREAVPAVRRWRGPGKNDDENVGFRRLAKSRDIYLPEPMWEAEDPDLDTFHAVTICDAGSPAFNCSASAVLGTESRSFYVSSEAVYVWTGEIDLSMHDQPTAFLYRLPLDGSEPQAIEARGDPVDQFSFREDRSDGILNVVVRADSGGDKMWRSETSSGDTALLRIRLADFGNGSYAALHDWYRDLPAKGSGFQNRFVGKHLLYATDAYDRESSASALRAVPLDGGQIRLVTLPHAVTRLDVIGTDGVAIGANDEETLGFSAIRLDASSGEATLEDTFFFADSAEGENRSQAFFYNPDPTDPEGTSGILALPVSRYLDGSAARFLGSSSSVAFLNRRKRKLSEAGTLDANAESAVDDNCKASCVDWYGNARPIFLGGRIFALMGYELVEGELADGRIVERRRVNFAPGNDPGG